MTARWAAYFIVKSTAYLDPFYASEGAMAFLLLLFALSLCVVGLIVIALAAGH